MALAWRRLCDPSAADRQLRALDAAAEPLAYLALYGPDRLPRLFRYALEPSVPTHLRNALLPAIARVLCVHGAGCCREVDAPEEEELRQQAVAPDRCRG